MRSKHAKTSLIARAEATELPLGMIVSSIDPAITDILGNAGYDFVIIDNEHGPIDPGIAQHHVRAAEAAGMIPMVRVGQNEPNLIGKFLDIGCQGVFVPHVDTAEDARRAVAATRFAPGGVRGMCPASHAAGYRGGDTTPFVTNAEAETLVGVIIESRLGVENADEIAAVDGVDVVFFGPGDFSYEAGVVSQGWASSVVQEASARVVDAARRAGKLVMAITLAESSAESARALFDQGADLVVVYMDLLLIQRLLESFTDAKRLRPAMGARAQRDGVHAATPR